MTKGSWIEASGAERIEGERTAENGHRSLGVSHGFITDRRKTEGRERSPGVCPSLGQGVE